jgi:hypothetical protein
MRTRQGLRRPACEQRQLADNRKRGHAAAELAGGALPAATSE